MLTGPWLGLINPVGAPLESVVESAETLREEGFHLMKGPVAVVNPLYIYIYDIL